MKTQHITTIITITALKIIIILIIITLSYSFCHGIVVIGPTMRQKNLAEEQQKLILFNFVARNFSNFFSISLCVFLNPKKIVVKIMVKQNINNKTKIFIILK